MPSGASPTVMCAMPCGCLRALQVDRCRCVQAAVGGTATAVISRDRQPAVRRNNDVVRERKRRHVELVVRDLVAVHIQEGDFVVRRPHRQGMLAIRRKHHLRHVRADRDGPGLCHFRAIDLQHRDGTVSAVAHQRHIATRAERQARRLLAHSQCVHQLRRVGVHVDDEQFIRRHQFADPIVLRHGHQVRLPERLPHSAKWRG